MSARAETRTVRRLHESHILKEYWLEIRFYPSRAYDPYTCIFSPTSMRINHVNLLSSTMIVLKDDSLFDASFKMVF